MNQTPTTNDDRFHESYLRLCQKQGRPITSQLDVRPGDFLVGPNGLRLFTGANDQKADDEVVVPDLDRILSLLQAEAPVVVLDTQVGDFGLTAFDEYNRSLANVVSRNAPEACMRALLFVTSERRANEVASGVITLSPSQNRSES